MVNHTISLGVNYLLIEEQSIQLLYRDWKIYFLLRAKVIFKGIQFFTICCCVVTCTAKSIFESLTYVDFSLSCVGAALPSELLLLAYSSGVYALLILPVNYLFTERYRREATKTKPRVNLGRAIRLD